MASTEVFGVRRRVAAFRRRVAPARVGSSPQVSEKRRRAGALQNIKFGISADPVPIVSLCIFNYILVNTLFFAPFRSGRQGPRLTQVNERNGPSGDLRQNAVPLLDAFILNQDRADGTG